MTSARAKARSLADRVQDALPGPIRALVQRARRDDILLLSAGLAFYSLVSLVPLVIISLWIASLLIGDDRIQQFADQLRRISPNGVGVDRALEAIVQQGSRLGVAAFLFGLWPATSYGAGLVRAFERLAPAREERERTPLLGRVIVLVVLLPFFVIGTLLASYMGSTILGEALFSQILGAVLALVAGFVAAAVAIASIYWIFPPEQLDRGAIVKGTAVAAIGISVLSLVFVAYLNLGANFEKHYATSGLAAVTLLAVWLFLSNVMLLVGYKFALDA
jgi:membrane protein